MLNTVVSVRDTVDDAEEAVAARMDRQRVLHAGGRCFAFLMEEWVLRTVMGDTPPSSPSRSAPPHPSPSSTGTPRRARPAPRG
ncbi:Scr1 family TA system antitoxin-like transcriptional regulator [Streptomyces alboflavus]|uniref:Scr1 family TA system antitoxin-like transcriptional regulator n=1 Tax=Streptomyces alboflavus TaxID=67267 RepID=UPI00368426EF